MRIVKLAKPMLAALAACAASVAFNGVVFADDAQTKALQDQMRAMQQQMQEMQNKLDALTKQQAVPPAVVQPAPVAPPPPARTGSGQRSAQGAQVREVPERLLRNSRCVIRRHHEGHRRSGGAPLFPHRSQQPEFRLSNRSDQSGPEKWPGGAASATCRPSRPTSRCLATAARTKSTAARRNSSIKSRCSLQLPRRPASTPRSTSNRT